MVEVEERGGGGKKINEQRYPRLYMRVSGKILFSESDLSPLKCGKEEQKMNGDITTKKKKTHGTTSVILYLLGSFWSTVKLSRFLR